MNRVRELRKKSGMRMVDLAKKAAVSITTLWLIENDFDERTSREIKERISKALRCRYEEVFPKKSENLKEAKIGAL